MHFLKCRIPLYDIGCVFNLNNMLRICLMRSFFYLAHCSQFAHVPSEKLLNLLKLAGKPWIHSKELHGMPMALCFQECVAEP